MLLQLCRREDVVVCLKSQRSLCVIQQGKRHLYHIHLVSRLEIRHVLCVGLVRDALHHNALLFSYRLIKRIDQVFHAPLHARRGQAIGIERDRRRVFRIQISAGILRVRNAHAVSSAGSSRRNRFRTRSTPLLPYMPPEADIQFSFSCFYPPFSCFTI